MEPTLTRCGYRCDLCLAYRPNVERDPSSQQKLSDGWFTYFGFRIPPEQIVCDGCLADGSDIRLLDAGCPVRPCVVERGLDTCAQCADYGCERLQQRLVVYEEIKGAWAPRYPRTTAAASSCPTRTSGDWIRSEWNADRTAARGFR